MSEQQKKKQRWVIKIGSALLTNNGTEFAENMLDQWVPQIAELIQRGIQVVLVSSGAVAEGVNRLKLGGRPNDVALLQAAASAGQSSLIQAYENRFQAYDICTAQILLVNSDLSNRARYLNATRTIDTLLKLGALPIVNENDTVTTDEIRFGDNDTLAGLVANLISANKMVILTDQQGVFDDDPRKSQNAKLISTIDVDDELLDAVAKGSGNAQGRGGMITKIRAARVAADAGTETTIANGLTARVLTRIADGEAVGSRLTSTRKPLTARKRWLARSLKISGEIHLDEGASKAIHNSGVSLLPIGVTKASGNFLAGDLVCCLDNQGKEIARGISAYTSKEVNLIAGKSSEQREEILGYVGEEELIHRNNLVVL